LAAIEIVGNWIRGAPKRMMVPGKFRHALDRHHQRSQFSRLELRAQRGWDTRRRAVRCGFVKVRFSAAKEMFAKGEQARLEIVASESKKVLRRERLADVYVGPDRVVHRGFYLANIGCTPLDIVVTARPKVIRKALHFNCGE
jgi:hypothetical protein